MEIIPTALDGVVEIRPPRHGDDRGWFSEVYKRHTLRDAGIDIEFVQDNESFSAPTGTLRGLHYQLPPHAQDKLVRVIHGSILDIAVDIRRDSATFGQHVAVTLTADTRQPAARARRVRPRVLHARARHPRRLQGERRVRARLRTRHPLGRPRPRHRLAAPTRTAPRCPARTPSPPSSPTSPTCSDVSGRALLPVALHGISVARVPGSGTDATEIAFERPATAPFHVLELVRDRPEGPCRRPSLATRQGSPREL